MGRIRSIKPEFCVSEQAAEVTRDARLHFVCMWTYADDEGRGVDNPKLLKAALWPLDDAASPADVEGWQSELATVGLIVRYEVAGRRYFVIPSFRDHQHPKRFVESKIPPPPGGEVFPACGPHGGNMQGTCGSRSGGEGRGDGEELEVEKEMESLSESTFTRDGAATSDEREKPMLALVDKVMAEIEQPA